MDSESVLAKLRVLKARAAVRYKVKELGMFGSFGAVSKATKATLTCWWSLKKEPTCST